MFNAQNGVFNPEDVNIGALKVLRTILSMDYLWNRIRVLGGAYGSGISFGRDGQISMSTFRDPNLAKTFENFNNIAEYVKDLELDQDEIDKYIIGTISGFDVPLSTKAKLTLASNSYFTDITDDIRQAERDEILSTNLDDLRNNAIILENALKQENYSSIGAENIINENKSRFEDIEYVN